MDLKDQLKQLSETVSKIKNSILTEEATKTSFVMPFLSSLGYNVFNPFEVNPEYICDIGIKKGEKIDYAIMKDGEPIILIECKHWSKNLEPHDGQLLRYYHVSKAKFAILTNGIVYRFYTDLVNPNRMDEKPFMEFNITDLRDNQVEELKKFHKSYFNIETILSTASDLKYLNEIKQHLHTELNTPSPDFVKHFAWKVHQGPITQKALEYYSNLIKKATHQYITDMLRDRLKSALAKESDQEKQEVESTDAELKEPKVVTTVEEMEAFLIVRGIVRGKIAGARVHSRDAQSYFSVLLDDNNRKPICRLYMNGSKKQIGVFDSNREEAKYEIKSLDDIYNYSEQLRGITDVYDKAKDLDPIPA